MVKTKKVVNNYSSKWIEHVTEDGVLHGTFLSQIDPETGKARLSRKYIMGNCFKQSVLQEDGSYKVWKDVGTLDDEIVGEFMKIFDSPENIDVILAKPELVDCYVKMLLKNVGIDKETPSREDRLKAALIYHTKGDKFSPIEIMVGRRVDSSEPFAKTMAFLMVANQGKDPRTFYEGFAHQYYPEQ